MASRQESSAEAEAAATAFSLRLQLLEALVGLNTPAARRTDTDLSVTRRGYRVVEGVQDTIDKAGSEAVKRFLDRYQANAPLLVPQLPQASESDLTPRAKAAIVLESEDDLRNIDRELREIETLERRGSAGAGNLAVCEPLVPRLAELRSQLVPVSTGYTHLEKRVENILGSYDDYVNTISELFVTWNDALTQAEKTIARLEREQSK